METKDVKIYQAYYRVQNHVRRNIRKAARDQVNNVPSHLIISNLIVKSFGTTSTVKLS